MAELRGGWVGIAEWQVVRRQCNQIFAADHRAAGWQACATRHVGEHLDGSNKMLLPSKQQQNAIKA